MYELLSQQQMEELSSDISELIENVYICLSFSKEKTLKHINEKYTSIKEDLTNKSIIARLVKIKGLLTQFKKYNLNNLVNYVESQIEEISYKTSLKEILSQLNKFIVLYAGEPYYSKLWGSSLKTYLLISPFFERVVVFREKDSLKGIEIKEDEELEVCGSFDYYPKYNRLKGLKGHAIKKTGLAFEWTKLDYLDYNLQDARQVTKTTAFNYFVIDPLTEQLSFFFTSPVVAINLSPSPDGAIKILVKDYYGYKDNIYISNTDFLRRYNFAPEQIIEKKGCYFLVKGQIDLSGRIIIQDLLEISQEDFNRRGFVALLRFRKVKMKVNEKEIKSEYIYEAGNQFYYIPHAFSSYKEEFYNYITKPGRVLGFIHVVNEVNNYFRANPDVLELYRGNRAFWQVHPPLIEKIPSDERMKIPQKVFGHQSAILFIKNGEVANLESFINKFKEIKNEEIPFVQIVADEGLSVSESKEMMYTILTAIKNDQLKYILKKDIRIADKKILIFAPEERNEFTK